MLRSILKSLTAILVSFTIFAPELFSSESSKENTKNIKSSKLKRKFVHCEDSDGGLTELATKKGTRLIFCSASKKDRLVTIDHVFDDKLLEFNKRLFRLNIGGHYPNHAFLSMEIGFLESGIKDSDQDSFVSRQFVLVFNHDLDRLIFIDADEHEKSFTNNKNSYADFCNHPPSVKKKRHFESLSEDSLDVEIIDAPSSELCRQLPPQVMNNNENHSESRIFSAILADPQILRSAFSQIKKAAKIKFLIFRVHSSLDCCRGCQKTLQYIPLLVRRFLLRHPEITSDHILFSKKASEKSWMIPVVVTASNCYSYKKNDYHSTEKLKRKNSGLFSGDLEVKKLASLALMFIPTFVSSFFDESYGKETTKKYCTSFNHHHELGEYTAILNERSINLRELAIAKDGDCGFRGIGISREQALTMLIDNSSDESIRQMVLDDMREALQVGELPNNEIFSNIRDIHQELTSARSNLDFWTQVLNRNLRYQFEGGSRSSEEILSFLAENSRINEQFSANSIRLAEALRSVNELEEQEITALSSQDAYLAFITDYLIHGGWLSYVRGGLGLLSALGELTNTNIYVWVRSNDNPGEIELNHQALSEGASRVVHLLHTDSMTHFNLLLETDDQVDMTETNQEQETAIQGVLLLGLSSAVINSGGKKH